MSLFTKALSVVESCNNGDQLSVALRYLVLAMDAGLHCNEVITIHGILAGKWRDIYVTSLPAPIATSNHVII